MWGHGDEVLHLLLLKPLRKFGGLVNGGDGNAVMIAQALLGIGDDGVEPSMACGGDVRVAVVEKNNGGGLAGGEVAVFYAEVFGMDE